MRNRMLPSHPPKGLSIQSAEHDTCPRFCGVFFFGRGRAWGQPSIRQSMTQRPSRRRGPKPRRRDDHARVLICRRCYDPPSIVSVDPTVRKKSAPPKWSKVWRDLPQPCDYFGAYTTEQLERMNQEFTAAVERAFRAGDESEMAATATYDLRRR
jgi:hypothetical protein